MLTTRGLVSEYEEREAAVYTHYTPKEWSTLSWQERAQSVAQYRCHFLIEAHMQEAVTRATNRDRR